MSSFEPDCSALDGSYRRRSHPRRVFRAAPKSLARRWKSTCWSTSRERSTEAHQRLFVSWPRAAPLFGVSAEGRGFFGQRLQSSTSRGASALASRHKPDRVSPPLPSLWSATRGTQAAGRGQDGVCSQRTSASIRARVLRTLLPRFSRFRFPRSGWMHLRVAPGPCAAKVDLVSVPIVLLSVCAALAQTGAMPLMNS